MPELTLFISHRSTDVKLAKAIVHLFEKTLKLPSRQIRCTSVEGYRLPVGADTDEQLRREVFEARAFIGVITPSAATSPYVLFELGARWGAKKHLAPILARGADHSYLGGPLGGINALFVTDRNQVLQLVEDIAEYLQFPVEPAPSFQEFVDAVVAAANELVKPVSIAEKLTDVEELDEMELKVLTQMGQTSSTRPHDLAQKMGLPLQKASYYLDRLLAAKLLLVDLAFGDAYYKITQSGRTLLVTKEPLHKPLACCGKRKLRRYCVV